MQTYTLLAPRAGTYQMPAGVYVTDANNILSNVAHEDLLGLFSMGCELMLNAPATTLQPGDTVLIQRNGVTYSIPAASLGGSSSSSSSSTGSLLLLGVL